MAQFTQPNPLPPPSYRRGSEPSWLWLLLVAGSIAVHLLLVVLSVPFLSRLSEQQTVSSAVSVDLIELPPQAPAELESEIAVAPEENTSSPSAAASPPQPAADQVTPPVANPAPAPAAPDAIGFSPEIPASFTPPSPDPVAPSPPTPFVAPPLSQLPPLTPAPPLEESTPTEDLSSPDPVSDADPTQPDQQNSENTDPLSAANRDPDDAQGFSTVPIDIPVPDVSETLPLPADDPNPSELAQTEIDPTAAPIALTASLSLDRIPTSTPEESLEQLAAPVAGTTLPVIADPRISPCAQEIQPGVLSALGTPVTLQVSTDVQGQVIQTTPLEPSQNQAYDALAQCLVQNWEFSPATLGGEPVPSDALLVRIVLEQSQ